MHSANSFITLTFSREHLPDDYSVHKRTLQLFMKRLRKEIGYKIRFLGCGEYGEQNLRPHYHALIFGYAFPDRVIYARSAKGIRYTSVQLDKAWGFGRTEVGLFSPVTARYCVGYVMKKITGDKAPHHYMRTHPHTGSTVQVEPEFQLQSGRPGIGFDWFQKYKSDCFPSDFLILDGRQVPVPRYYHKLLDNEEQERIRRQRKRSAATPQAKANRSPERLRARDVILAQKQSMLSRNLKDDDQ